MKLKLFALAVAAAAVLIGAHVYLSDPLTIEYGEWRAAPPLSLALAAALLGLAALWLALRILGALFSLPTLLAGWRGRAAGKKRDKLVADGLRAVGLRDAKAALRNFAALAQNEADPAAPAGALLAAKAAHERGETERRDNWLRAAAAAGDLQAAAFAGALLARNGGELDAAAAILQRADALKGPPALRRLLLEIAAEKGEWQLALTAAYKEADDFPRRAKTHDRPGGRGGRREMPRDIIRRLLADDAADAATLRTFWKEQVRSAERADPELLAAHILALKARGDPAEHELDAAVKARADAPEILEAVVLAGDPKRCEAALKRAEDLPQKRRETAPMLRAMAELAARLKLWGKARRYYQMAQAVAPDPRNLRAMAELAETLARARDDDDRAAAKTAPPGPTAMTDPERETA